LKDLAVIDLETTGLNPDECGITEIYLVRATLENILNDDRDKWTTYHCYLLPDIACTVSKTAAQLTGYDRNKWNYTYDARQFYEVENEIIPLLDDVILTGWNIEFDRQFILAECHRWGTPLPQWDYHRFDISTLAMRLYYEGLLESLSMSKAAEYFGLDMTGLHSAKADVELSIKILKLLW